MISEAYRQNQLSVEQLSACKHSFACTLRRAILDANDPSKGFRLQVHPPDADSAEYRAELTVDAKKHGNNEFIRLMGTYAAIHRDNAAVALQSFLQSFDQALLPVIQQSLKVAPGIDPLNYFIYPK